MPGGMLSDAPGSGITCLHSSCSLPYLPAVAGTVPSSIHLPPLPTLFLSYVLLLRWVMYGLVHIVFFFTLFDVLCVWNSSTVPSLKSEINCSSFLFLFYRNNELPKKVYRNGVLLVYNYQPMCCCSWFGVVAVVVQCCCCYCCCCCCCVRACVRVCVCVCACVVVFAVVSFL